MDAKTLASELGITPKQVHIQEEREKEEKRRAAREKAEQEKRDRQALLDKEFWEKLKQQPKTQMSETLNF